MCSKCFNLVEERISVNKWKLSVVNGIMAQVAQWVICIMERSKRFTATVSEVPVALLSSPLYERGNIELEVIEQNYLKGL